MIKTIKSLIFAAMLGITTISAAQPMAQSQTYPVLDLAWGIHGNGTAYLGFDLGGSDDDYATSGTLLPDGRLLMGGYAQTGSSTQVLAFGQLLQDGAADPAFGNADGRTTLALAHAVTDIAKLADGRSIYVASTSSYSVAIGRLLADGSPDSSFDLDGHRIVGPSALLPFGEISYSSRIAPLADGKLLLMVGVGSNVLLKACAGFMRLLSDGSNDPGFGNGAGTVCVGPPVGAENPIGFASDFKLLADGRILVTLSAYHTGGSYLDMALGRLLPDGTLDTSFGSNGWAFAAFDQGGRLEDRVEALTVDDDGRIVLAGYATVDDTNHTDVAVARFLANGQMDTGFGTQGRVLLALGADDGLEPNERSHSVALAADGSILIGADADGASFGRGSLVIRLTPDGQPDPWFGFAGVYLHNQNATNFDDVLQANRILLGGDYLYLIGDRENPDTSNQDFAAARLIVPLFASGFEPGVFWRQDELAPRSASVMVKADVTSTMTSTRPSMAILLDKRPTGE